jgi:hypothetical protein
MSMITRDLEDKNVLLSLQIQPSVLFSCAIPSNPRETMRPESTQRFGTCVSDAKRHVTRICMNGRDIFVGVRVGVPTISILSQQIRSNYRLGPSTLMITLLAS